MRKVIIENNRIVQVVGTPISIEGNGDYQNLLVKIKDNRIQNCGIDSKLFVVPGATEAEKVAEVDLMEAAFSKNGGKPQACILLQNLKVFNILVSRNTISKGTNCGIKLYNVKASNKDMNQLVQMPHDEVSAERVLELCIGDQDRVKILDNYVTDIADGIGMIIDSSTARLEQNQVKKNP